uniref:Uncharacterized protein n=1 Tax=Octopus bimaculoides TaxID=37653 RepID=A0A0L8I330_OCTBM
MHISLLCWCFAFGLVLFLLLFLLPFLTISHSSRLSIFSGIFNFRFDPCWLNSVFVSCISFVVKCKMFFFV